MSNLPSEDQNFRYRAGDWLGTELRTWLPTLIILISAITYFVSQSGRIANLEARAATADAKVEEYNKSINSLQETLARIDERTQAIKANVDEIKSAIKDK